MQGSNTAKPSAVYATTVMPFTTAQEWWVQVDTPRPVSPATIVFCVVQVIATSTVTVGSQVHAIPTSRKWNAWSEFYISRLARNWIWRATESMDSRVEGEALVRKRQTPSRVPPAMEAGMSDHVWTVEDIAGLLE